MRPRLTHTQINWQCLLLYTHVLHCTQALSALTELDVHHNRLTSLAGITQLRQLASINVAANQLQVLPNLAALSALTQLNLKHNRLQCLVATAEPVPSPSGVTCRQHQRQQQQQLESNVAAAPATEAIPAAGGNACSSSASQHNQLLLLLPSSLKRLSLACNNIQQLADLSPLQQLPLLDLCVDGNPFTAPSRQPQLADRASGGGFGPGGGVGGGPGVGRQWYREAVLAAACNPCLLMLDGQPVSKQACAFLSNDAQQRCSWWCGRVHTGDTPTWPQSCSVKQGC